VVLALSFAAIDLLSGTPARAAESEFRIIVDSANTTTSATRETIVNAFLKTSSRWPDGEPIRPVDQRPDAPVRRTFSESILRRSVAAVRSYWQQRIFSGRDVPPPELESDEAVVRYVGEHRGAIGYVSSSARTGEVRVITVK
jgi:hypothetical protein